MARRRLMKKRSIFSIIGEHFEEGGNAVIGRWMGF
jgi:hypothetical protein